MAQDAMYDFSAGPTVTLLSADVSDGAASALTGAVDFGTPTPFGFGFELILTTGTGCTDTVSLEIAWSHDNSDFSDTDNLETVTVMKCTASTDKKKCGAYPVKARYAKFRIDNQSGGTIDGTASNSALILTDLAMDQA